MILQLSLNGSTKDFQVKSWLLLNYIELNLMSDLSSSIVQTTSEILGHSISVKIEKEHP